MPEQEQLNEPIKENLDPKVSATLAYFLWLIGGIVFFVISKNPYVRFHAMQSILFNASVAVIYIFFMIFGFMFWILLGPLSYLLWMAGFAVWIILMIKAYQGEKFKLPIIGKYAEKLAK